MLYKMNFTATGYATYSAPHVTEVDKTADAVARLKHSTLQAFKALLVAPAVQFPHEVQRIHVYSYVQQIRMVKVCLQVSPERPAKGNMIHSIVSQFIVIKYNPDSIQIS